MFGREYAGPDDYTKKPTSTRASCWPTSATGEARSRRWRCGVEQQDDRSMMAAADAFKNDVAETEQRAKDAGILSYDGSGMVKAKHAPPPGADVILDEVRSEKRELYQAPARV